MWGVAWVGMEQQSVDEKTGGGGGHSTACGVSDRPHLTSQPPPPTNHRSISLSSLSLQNPPPPRSTQPPTGATTPARTTADASDTGECGDDAAAGGGGHEPVAEGALDVVLSGRSQNWEEAQRAYRLMMLASGISQVAGENFSV